MIEYQNFIATVSSLLPSYMPEEFRDIKVTHDRVPDSNTSVMLYCNDLYSAYQRIGNITDVLTGASDMIIHAFRNKPKYACVEELTKDPEKKIIFQLVQTKRNRELLKDIPHRNFLDLSIIYRIVANSTDDRGAALPVCISEYERNFAAGNRNYCLHTSWKRGRNGHSGT